ncbi:hypothetical protein O181_056008 [Austropuccinia psidii MF-1]|uniref:Uncharacterized protein n=1 Tax=Austropuccinia psidii MF-1 TaxID=1389203 RepID=A0A9Q3HT13_9BASI|nr:hypothetical protein [Austropuccinia psidii MF-1]
MSSKLTELIKSSPSALPPSFLHGSGILSQFSSPSMASSGHFDPTQTYDGYKAVEYIDPAFTECLAKGKDCFEHYNPRSSKCHYCFIGKKPCVRTGKKASNIRRYLWNKKDGPFGKEFPVSEAPTLDGTSGYSSCKQRDVAIWNTVGRPIYSSSEVPISRINTEGIVKRIRQIANSPPDPDAEGSDELDGEEVEVVPNSAGNPSNTSPSQPPAQRFQSQVSDSTPRTFQPTLSTILPTSPNSSHPRPAFNSAARPSPIQQPRNSPIVTTQQLQPVAREDPNTSSDNQDSVAKLFRRVDRNSREVIIYANDRNIPGTPSEEMAAKFACYKDGLIN